MFALSRTSKKTSDSTITSVHSMTSARAHRVGIDFLAHTVCSVERRSNIEVHPTFSPYLTLLGPQSRFGDNSPEIRLLCPQIGTSVLKGLRSSIPHLKTDFSKTQIASRRIIPCPSEVYKIKFVSEQDWHSDDFGFRNPVIQKTFLRKCATSVAERDSRQFSKRTFLTLHTPSLLHLEIDTRSTFK